MRTRIADEYKAIADRMRQLNPKQKKDVLPTPCDHLKGYFFEVFSKKHRGKAGRVLIMHPFIDTHTDVWNVCPSCDPEKCGCAVDAVEAQCCDDYDPKNDGFPDVYFCADCP